MKYNLQSLAISVLLSGMLAGCHTSEPPVDNDDCLWDLSSRHPVKIHLNVDRPLKFFTDVDADSVTDEQPISRSSDSEPVMRYTVKVFAAGTDREVASEVSFSDEITLSLPVGKLDIIAWADYALAGNYSDRFFFTDEWDELLVYSKFPYVANNNEKMGYWGKQSLTMPYNLSDVYVNLDPAMGQLRIIATDSPRDDVAKIRVSYPGRIPSAISGFSGEVCYSWADVYFHTEAVHYDNGTSLIGFDNIFAGVIPSAISVRIEMTDGEGNVVARRLGINVPVKRGGVTELRGAFYSIIEQEEQDPPGGGDEGGGGDDNNGGVGVDPALDSEIVIDIN